jgi:hypothetical protein
MNEECKKTTEKCRKGDKENVVYFLLGNSPGSEFIRRSFGTLSVPSSSLPSYEDVTDSVFRNVGI